MTDPKPPTRAPLSRPRILKAALRLIDERGLDALSMRSLGAELGVEAMSLYRHVPSKAALLDGVVELMLAEVATDPLPAGLPWRGLLADVARRYRSLARRHPGAFVLLVEHPERGYVAGRDATVGVLTALEAAGFTPDDAIRAMRTLMRFVIGFALAERAEDRAGEDAGMAAVRLAEAGYRPVAALVGRLGPGHDEDLFDFGLRAVVEGLALAARPTPPPGERAPAAGPRRPGPAGPG